MGLFDWLFGKKADAVETTDPPTAPPPQPASPPPPQPASPPPVASNEPPPVTDIAAFILTPSADGTAFVAAHWDDPAPAMSALGAAVVQHGDDAATHVLLALARFARENPSEAAEMLRPLALPDGAREMLRDPLAWLDQQPRAFRRVSEFLVFEEPDLWDPAVALPDVGEVHPAVLEDLTAVVVASFDRFVGRLLRERREQRAARHHAALVGQGSRCDLGELWSWCAELLREGGLDADCGELVSLYANALARIEQSRSAKELGPLLVLVGRAAGLKGMPDGSLYDAFEPRAFQACVYEFNEILDRPQPVPSGPSRGRHAVREAFLAPDWADTGEVLRRVDLVSKDFRDVPQRSLLDLATAWLARSAEMVAALPQERGLAAWSSDYAAAVGVVRQKQGGAEALEDLWALLHQRAQNDDGLLVKLGANAVLRVLEDSHYEAGPFDGGLLPLMAWLSLLSSAVGAPDGRMTEGVVDVEMRRSLAAEAARLLGRS